MSLEETTSCGSRRTTAGRAHIRSLEDAYRRVVNFISDAEILKAAHSKRLRKEDAYKALSEKCISLDHLGDNGVLSLHELQLLDDAAERSREVCVFLSRCLSRCYEEGDDYKPTANDQVLAAFQPAHPMDTVDRIREIINDAV